MKYNFQNISIWVDSLELGQFYDCPGAREVTLNDMGKLSGIKPQPLHISWDA